MVVYLILCYGETRQYSTYDEASQLASYMLHTRGTRSSMTTKILPKPTLPHEVPVLLRPQLKEIGTVGNSVLDALHD